MARLVIKNPEVFKEIGEAIVNDPAVTNAIGRHLVTKCRGAFTAQRRGPVIWPERHVPNVAGILHDLNTGSSIDPKRWSPRPAGVDTGALKASITFRTTKNQIILTSNVPYAGDFEEGGERTIQITQMAMTNLGKLLQSGKRNKAKGLHLDKRTREGKAQDRISKLAWIMGKGKRDGSVKLKVPPRPFLTIEDEDLDEIAEIVKRAAGKL